MASHPSARRGRHRGRGASRWAGEPQPLEAGAYALADAPTAAALGAYGPAGRSAWMDVDWREHQRFVRMDGRALNVIELGEGEPAMVFVHGLSGSWQNWLENLPHFAARHRVLAFDLPGFGASEMPREKISMSWASAPP
jgi:alpha/beta hydrolase family protein